MSNIRRVSGPSRAARAPRAVLARFARGGDDGGFILLEVMLSLTLITVIMAAISVEYMNGLVVSAQQRSSATAAQIASTAMSDLRANDPSDLLNGRGETAVRDQRESLLLIPGVKRWITQDARVMAYDNAAGTAVVPTSPKPSNAAGRSFDVHTYLECEKPSDAAAGSRVCTSAATATTIRAVVAVSWKERGCPTAGCAFVSSTLIDGHANPTFDINEPLPPAPIVDDQAETVVIGDPRSVSLSPRANTGVPPYTWAVADDSALPSGLVLDEDTGVISGVPTGPAGTVTTTIVVTDSFYRPDEMTITWTVVAKLAFPAPMVTDLELNRTYPPAAPAATARATGGTPPYTYSDPGSTLPSGLAINATSGVISGTPTTIGTSRVRLTVRDSSGQTVQTAVFDWKVAYAPLTLTAVPTQTGTVGVKATASITASGGSATANYRWSVSGLPSGLALVGTGASRTIEMTPPASSLGDQRITVRVTDAVSGQSGEQTFTLRVLAGPSVNKPADATTTRNGSGSVQLSGTCANAPCTWAVSSAPAATGFSFATGSTSTTATLNWRPTVNTGAYAVTVRLTDASGVVDSETFTWTVVAAPTFASPDDQTTRSGTAASVGFSRFVNGGTGGYTYSSSTLPSWARLDTATGVVTGNAPTGRGSTTGVRITATDSSGVAVTSTSFTWYWSTLQWNGPSPLYTVNRGATFPTITLNDYVSGGSTFFGLYSSFAASGLPSGLTLENAGFSGWRLRGTVSSTAERKDYPVTLTVTDNDGATASTTFIIRVS